MHLLFLTHNFPPEFGGAATMQYELGKHMVAAGHKVTVITSHSQHHMRVNVIPYRSEEITEGIRVLRIRTPNFLGRGSFVQRALQDLVIEIGLVVKGLQVGRADVILVGSPPITLPIIAWILKALHKSILFLYVQDIFPELTVAMGILKQGDLAVRVGELLEKLAYSCADYIGAHSPKNRLHLISCGVPEKKANLVPLWVDTSFITPQPRRNSFSEKYSLNEKFVVMYAGTIGFAMGGQTIPQAASLLSNAKDVQFVVIGGGNKLDEMKGELERLEVENVLVLPLQPRDELPYVLASADILLVTLRKEATDNPNGYFRAVIPHKLLSNMSSARPILMAAEETADSSELVRLAQCGKVVLPEDPVALAEAILRMKQEQDDLLAQGKRGRAFVCDHFDSDMQVRRLEKLLCGLCNGELQALNNPWDISFPFQEDSSCGYRSDVSR